MVFARPDGASGGASAQTPAEIPRKYWRGDLLWALLGAGVVLLMRWPFLHLPLINNEGELANTARLLHRGSLLYRDHYANHTPLA